MQPQSNSYLINAMNMMGASGSTEKSLQQSMIMKQPLENKNQQPYPVFFNPPNLEALNQYSSNFGQQPKSLLR